MLQTSEIKARRFRARLNRCQKEMKRKKIQTNKRETYPIQKMKENLKKEESLENSPKPKKSKRRLQMKKSQTQIKE